MKVLENKSIFKKLIIVLLCILLFSFCVPKTVSADPGEIGGKLLNPVMSLFVSVGDGVMTLIQKVVLSVDESLIPIDSSSSFWAKVLVIATAIVVVSVIVAATVLTAGSAGIATIAGIAAALKGAAAITITIGATIITFPVTTQILEGMLPDNFQLPLFQITPQEIFSNKIPLLDVDFFNPSESIYIDNTETTLIKGDVIDQKLHKYIIEQLKKEYGYNDNIEESDSPKEETPLNPEYAGNYAKGTKVKKWKYKEKNYCFYYLPTSEGNDMQNWAIVRYNNDGTELEYLSEDHISTDESGANIININWKNGAAVWTDTNIEVKVKTEDHTYTEGEIEEIKSTASELQSTVSNWYTILRDISLVALLSILVYVGIRIIISSTSSDKAKYKQMLLDWIVAICLLFIMQYIMSFSNLLVKKIIEIIDTTQVSVDKETKVVEPEAFLITDKDKITKAYEVIIGDNGDSSNPYYKFFVDENGNPAGSDAKVLVWPAENFMQQARMQLQLLEDDTETYVAIGWKLIYVVLVVYTIIFMFTYIKRVIYMAFLTIIAPLVALTYPIDKINDGKAQAFNMWFKEYIFNLLIQPMHLILYTILISSAMDFASKNILYVVVALGFMVPAEKLLRSFFGFEKAHTPGLLAGPAGAAIMMSGVNKLLGKGSKGGKSANNAKKLESGQDDGKAPYINSNFDKQNAMIGDEDAEYQNGILDDVNNAERNMETLDELEDPSLEDPNYMYMHPDEYDENQEWLGPRQIGGESFNEELEQTESIHMNQGMNRNQEEVSDLPRRSLKRAIGSAARYYARGTARKLRNNFENYHPLRSSLKFASGVAGATVLGAAGGIAGITSGDPSKAVQYMAVGTVGGYKLTSGIPNKIVSSAPEGMGEVAMRSYFGSDEEYNKYKQAQYKRDYQMNEKNMLKIEQKYGAKEAKKIMKEVVPKCLDNGVTDMDDIITINEMVKTGAVKDIDMGISTAKYASRIGQDTTKMKKKDRDDWNKTFASEFSKNQRVRQNNMDSNKIADNVLSRVDKFYKIKNS